MDVRFNFQRHGSLPGLLVVRIQHSLTFRAMGSQIQMSLRRQGQSGRVPGKESLSLYVDQGSGGNQILVQSG